ncbi:MAG: hypothetical protein JSS49_02035 [Planctomycetes bacterium]|nr:hypothetical protein [Planctomycetota bacterium]
MVSATAHGAGKWTRLANPYPIGNSGQMLLLTDGTVIVQASDGPLGQSAFWYKLTPDSSGSYINGTWSQIASTNVDRGYYASCVLPNGKVLVLGAEVSSFGTAYDTGEIYDPIANTWTTIQYPEQDFLDGTSILLPTGKVLCGSASSAVTYLFDPATNKFTKSGTKLRNDNNDEETWALLPDNTVVTYESVASPLTPPGLAQRYDISNGTWSDTGSVPVALGSTNAGVGLGAVSLLPNGKVIYIGDTNSALFNPATNTWTAGPNMPANVQHIAQDEIGSPGAMLPDGHLMFVSATPVGMLDYDYQTNKVTDITLQLDPTLLSQMQSINPSPYRRMLLAPNGHLLFNLGNGVIWDYGTTGNPQASWRPTVTRVMKGTGASANVYTLTGTQLTGLWQGATCDDSNADTNYPIVRLTSNGVVYYARTTNWIPGVATGAKSTTVDFTLPKNLPNGAYQLAVIANGIASADFSFPFPFTNPPLQYNYVQATYDSIARKLTVVGDVNANAIEIDKRGNTVTVQAAGLTRIGTAQSNTQSKSFQVFGDFTILCNFNQSSPQLLSDSVSLVSVNSSNTTIQFGSGSDTATLTYCVIGTLSIDGGSNPIPTPDKVILVGTSVKVKNISNVP